MIIRVDHLIKNILESPILFKSIFTSELISINQTGDNPRFIDLFDQVICHKRSSLVEMIDPACIDKQYTCTVLFYSQMDG